MFVFKCTVHFESVTFPGHGRNPYLNLLSIHHAHNGENCDDVGGEN